MHKLEQKGQVEGTSSIYIPDAEADKITMEIRGNHYQETQEGTSNLAVLNEGSITQDGITIDIKDGVGTVSGTNTSSATIYIEIGTAYLYKDKKYYIKKVTGNGGYSLFKNGKTIWFPNSGESSFSVSETGEYSIRFSAGAGSTPKTTFKLSIYEMSGQEWIQGKKTIPSLEYPSKIETVKDNIKITQCNKNFFNVPSKNVGGVDLVLQEDGKYKINGTSTISWSFRTGEKTWLKAGDYTLSVEVESGTNNGFFGIRGSNGFKYEVMNSEFNFTLTEDKEIEPYFTCSGTATFDDVVVKVQLEKSKVKTEWAKHEQKEYNLSVQQEMLDGDYFDLENGKEVHNWKLKSFNGTENWYYNKEYPTRYALDLSSDSLNNDKQYCSHSKLYSTWGIEDNSFSVRSGTFYFNAKDISSLEEFKAKLVEENSKGTPLTFAYESSKQELDLTEEQKEVLDNMTTFKGINNIYFDNPLVNATVTYLPEIILTEADYIKSIKFYDTRFVPEEGIFGQTVMKQVDLEINNENQQLLLEDQEFELYLSTYYNEKEYNIKYGTFIVQKAEEENTNDNNEATCFDYMTKANQKYIDQVSYPCTMRELAENICEQLGLTLQTEKFRNDDFIVEDNQFVENETYRDVLKAIAMSAFSWARIDEHNVLRFDFNHNVEPIEELDYDQYYNLNKNEKMYGPVNKVVIGDSQIEGENVAVEDTESIATNGVHEVTILNNPFAYTQEKRIQLIEAGKELFGFTYLPINSMNTIGFIWLDCIDKISLKNMQDEVANTFVFDHTIEYDGTTLDEIASQALTETETKYTYTPETLKKLQRTEIVVDKQNQTITGIVEQTDGLNTQMTKVEQRVDGITQTVTDMGEDLNGKITETNSKIDQTAQSITLEVESVKEELDGKISQTNSKIDQTADSITAQVESVQKELDGKITETNSKIDQTAQSITSEVNNVKKDLDENYSTTEETDSKIEQTAENINLSVTESINNIQVGGTNLIPNSAPYNLDNWNNNNTTSIEATLSDEETAPFGKSIRIRTLNQPTAPGGVYIVPTTKVLEEGKEYCFSIWLRATAATVVTVGYARGGQTTFNVTTTYQKFTHKFTALAPTGSSHGFVVNIPAGTVPGRSVFFHSVKLEEGNKITAWSPAPSDDVKGSQIISSINISKEDIAINSDKISLKGKAINLTSDDITINSTNFSVDKNGNMSCKNANVAGTITSTVGKIAGFDIASNKLSTSKFGFNTTGNTIMWIGDENPDTSFFLVTDNGHIYCNTNDPDVSENEVCRMVLTWGDYSTEILPHVIRITDAYNLPDAETIISTTGITTPRVIQTSLESIKKNISLYNENALEKVLNNDIYTYNLKSENDTDKKHIGFIIGDKYRTPKEVISKEGNAIELYSTIGILWKAVQEQQKKIEELENKIKEK